MSTQTVPRTRPRFLFGPGILLALALTSPQLGAADLDLDGRINDVDRLIEHSTGAARIHRSDNPVARKKHAQARTQLDDARKARDAGDRDGSVALLGQATRSMFEAVRLAGGEDSEHEGSAVSFEARARSIEALSDALSRIGKEKHGEGSAEALSGEVKSTLRRARTLHEQGDSRQAQVLIASAYDKAKRAIEELRGGETLVRTLNFATKEEEYHYELDRNDTHTMLLDVLARDGARQSTAMTDRFLEKARSLRTRAEQEAAGGRHEAAVRSLELSTKELIRALRSTGVYIPG